MYRKNRAKGTTININASTQGEFLEEKIERIVNNKEPITDGAPIIFTERKEGVQPAYNIRTDRFEIAVEAMDKVSKTHIGRRDEKLKERQEAVEELNKKNGGAEPIQGTE